MLVVVVSVALRMAPKETDCDREHNSTQHNTCLLSIQYGNTHAKTASPDMLNTKIFLHLPFFYKSSLVGGRIILPDLKTVLLE